MQIMVELPDDIAQHPDPGREALDRLAIEGHRTVRQKATARPRNVVAVTIEGESTLKLLQEVEGKWVLASANFKYPPIEITSTVVIHGREKTTPKKRKGCKAARYR